MQRARRQGAGLGGGGRVEGEALQPAEQFGRRRGLQLFAIQDRPGQGGEQLAAQLHHPERHRVFQLRQAEGLGQGLAGDLIGSGLAPVLVGRQRPPAQQLALQPGQPGGQDVGLLLQRRQQRQQLGAEAGSSVAAHGPFPLLLQRGFQRPHQLAEQGGVGGPELLGLFRGQQGQRLDQGHQGPEQLDGLGPVAPL